MHAGMAPPLASFGRWHPMPRLWLEGRVWVEFVQLRRDPISSGQGVPDGRGRQVMLTTGLMAGDGSLDAMRGWLKRNGYRPMRSGIELNMQSSTVLVERIAKRIRAEVPRGKKVTVIGQSRGGTLGVGLAQKYPQLVERVIALGSPIAASMDVHPVTMLGVHAARAVHALSPGPCDINGEFDRQAP